ncbi:hypothetical protein BDF14DRAFT_1883808 [Spinellus fusiger]|nr:hypothetical protein BDF14DRAFT_1883808 [Spinellus fusiger]
MTTDPSSSEQQLLSAHDPPLPSAWSHVSLDQVTSYARQASQSIRFLSMYPSTSASTSTSTNASTSTSTSTIKSTCLAADEKRGRLHERTLKGLSKTLKLSLNDCSLGLYRVSDHIHRRVPRLVQDTSRLTTLGHDLETAILDIVDVRRVVGDMEPTQSFYHMSKMIKASLDIVRKSKN